LEVFEAHVGCAGAGFFVAVEFEDEGEFAHRRGWGG
jgi:hypothetical protein